MEGFMKKIWFVFVIFVVLLTVSTCGSDSETNLDPITWSLIGTWEAECEYVNTYNGFEYILKTRLTFTETEYDYVTDCYLVTYPSAPTDFESGIFEYLTSSGTYVCKEEEIVYTNTANREPHEYYSYTRSYIFIDENTIETLISVPGFGTGINEKTQILIRK
jgi:hypothetical protein